MRKALDVNEVSWMIGGAQGSGVDTSASIFAKSCGRAGLEIYGKREYHSNIKGLHSYFQIRVSDQLVKSITDRVDLLATFDEETLVRHAEKVRPEGGIIYDPALEANEVSSIPTLETEVGSRVRATLRARNLDENVAGILKENGERKVHLYPIPYEDLITEIAKKTGQKISELARMRNVLAVAASFALLGFEHRFLVEAISGAFRGKPEVVDLNTLGSSITYGYVKGRFGGEFGFRLKSGPRSERLLLTGNEAVALGKIAGGCRYQSYYPITPAADESVFIEAHEVFRVVSGNLGHEETGSILVVQTEDELAALTSATGAALAGVRASTSTSGPGFSVLVEGIGWAGMNEVPVVITLYQRAGPSTGLPTRHEQGDLRFALHAGHGEFPMIVLASGDIEECFYDAVRAFNYAEMYQTPVIHLVDKALANSNMTVKVPDVSGVKIHRGELLSETEVAESAGSDGGYLRFKFTDSGVSPRVSLGTKGAIFWNSGDEHDQYGHISENSENRVKMMEKRMRKLDTASREIPIQEKVNFFGEADAKVMVVSWGSPKGAVLDAMEILEGEGRRVGFLQVRMISPLLSEYLAETLNRAERLVSVEMNFSSQLAGLIREETGIKMHNHIVKYNGRPMSQDEVYNALKQILSGSAPNRVVLTHGA